MVVGKQVKDCWGKKGGGENEKGEMVFPLLNFSPNPQFLYFFPNSHAQYIPLPKTLKSLRDYHHLISLLIGVDVRMVNVDPLLAVR